MGEDMSKNKAPDWNSIRAEYLGGEISYRNLAKKCNVSFNTLKARAVKEQWSKQKEEVYHRSTIKVQQKTANAAADNAIIAQRIKQKLLIKLEEEIDRLPNKLGTETYQEVTMKDKDGHRQTKGIKYRLNDLTQSYKNLVGDLPEVAIGTEIEDDPLTKSLKEFAGTLEKDDNNADK